MSEYHQLSELSENELQTVINEAEKILQDKQLRKRKEVIAQINELASSVGITVEINENGSHSTRKGKKVAAKYLNPNDSLQTWSGRGIAPKWMQTLLDAGQDKSEFLI